MAILRVLLQQFKKIDRLDTEIICAYALEKSRAWVLARPDYQLTRAQEKKIRALLIRRAAGEPLAYLTGHKEFFGLDFLVDKRVLVPRPETELLVEEVLKEKNIKTIADIGTGSGCVAVALVKNNPGLKIYAGDISASALVVARRNAARHGAKIIFKKGDLLAPFKNIRLDAIVANLPYGWKEWKNNCSMETRGLKFEPTEALFTGRHGLQLYEKLLRQIKEIFLSNPFYLIPNTFHLFLEFDPRQTALLKKLIKKYLPDSSVETKTDLAGRDRVAIIKI